jgi:hypothetical protein
MAPVVRDERAEKPGQRNAWADLVGNSLPIRAVDAEREAAGGDPDGRGDSGEERADDRPVVPRAFAALPDDERGESAREDDERGEDAGQRVL